MLLQHVRRLKTRARGVKLSRLQVDENSRACGERSEVGVKYGEYGKANLQSEHFPTQMMPNFKLLRLFDSNYYFLFWRYFLVENKLEIWKIGRYLNILTFEGFYGR